MAKYIRDRAWEDQLLRWHLLRLSELLTSDTKEYLSPFLMGFGFSLRERLILLVGGLVTQNLR